MQQLLDGPMEDLHKLAVEVGVILSGTESRSMIVTRLVQAAARIEFEDTR